MLTRHKSIRQDFESFSTFLEWVVSTRVGTGHVCHYVDDFLFISGASARGSQSCPSVLNCFVDLCAVLGVPLAHDKTIEPTTKLTFLGLEINTVSQSVTIPQEKLPAINDKIETALRSAKITLKPSVPHWLLVICLPCCIIGPCFFTAPD